MDLINNATRLYKALQSQDFLNKKILIATDGGAAKFKGAIKSKGAANFARIMSNIGSIGFIITDEEGNPFIRCYGQPAGLNPQSFRSEICATLAALRFVTLYIQYFDEKTVGVPMTKLPNIQIYTDSKSMLDKIEAINKYPTAKYKMTMHPEYDVLLSLQSVIDTYPNRPTLNWVESHQNDRDEGNELELDAILNIEADALATEGLKNGSLKQKVPMDPSTCVQVHIENTTITRDLKRTIRRVTKTAPLMRYYKNRFDWDDITCERIDWEIFVWVYKARVKKKFGWTNKYHLKQLPTGERMQKRGGLDDERCCSCGASLETDDHLFQCPKRPQFQREILALIEEMKPKLAPHLFQILYTGIRKYICKYDDIAADKGPNIKSTKQFERIQSNIVSWTKMRQ